MSNVEWDELIHIEIVETVLEAEDCCMKTNKCSFEVVSSADLQQMQVDLDCVHAEDGLHLHGVRVVQDMHEADQSPLSNIGWNTFVSIGRVSYTQQEYSFDQRVLINELAGTLEWTEGLDFDAGILEKTRNQVFISLGVYRAGRDRFFALGWLLKEIHVTWAHLEKKQTRLQTYTKSLEDLCIQWLETASQA
ncbi:hypothetical protein Tco_0397272 [Tanacetum coccineum]